MLRTETSKPINAVAQTTGSFSVAAARHIFKILNVSGAAGHNFWNL